MSTVGCLPFFLRGDEQARKETFFDTYCSTFDAHDKEEQVHNARLKLWEKFKECKTEGANPEEVKQQVLDAYPDEANFFCSDLNRWLKVAFQAHDDNPYAGEWIIEQELSEQRSFREQLAAKDPEGFTLFAEDLKGWGGDFIDRASVKRNIQSQGARAKRKWKKFQRKYPAIKRQWETTGSCFEIVTQGIEEFKRNVNVEVKSRKATTRVVEVALLIAFFVSALVPIFCPHLWWISFPTLGGGLIIMIPNALIKSKAESKEKHQEARVILKQMLSSFKERVKYPLSVYAFPLFDDRLKSDTMELQKEKYSKQRPESSERLRRLSENYDLADTTASKVRAASVHVGIKDPYSKNNRFAQEIASQTKANMDRGRRVKDDAGVKDDLFEEGQSNEGAALQVYALNFQLAKVRCHLERAEELSGDSPYFKAKIESLSDALSGIEEKISSLGETGELLDAQARHLRGAIFKERSKIKAFIKKHPLRQLEEAEGYLEEIATLINESELVGEDLFLAQAKQQQCLDLFKDLHPRGNSAIASKAELKLFNKEMKAFRRNYLFPLRAELQGQDPRRSFLYLPVEMFKDVVEACKLIFGSETKKKNTEPRAQHRMLRCDQVKQIQLDQKLFAMDRKLTSAIRIKERSMRLVTIVTHIALIILFFTVGMYNPWVGAGLLFSGAAVNFVTYRLGRKIETLEKEKLSLKVQRALIKQPEIPKEIAGDNPELQHLVDLSDKLGLDGVQITMGKLLVKGSIREKKSIFNELPEVPVFKTDDPKIPAYGTSREKWALPDSITNKIAQMQRNAVPPEVKEKKHLRICLKQLNERQKGFDAEILKLENKLEIFEDTADLEDLEASVKSSNQMLTRICLEMGDTRAKLRQSFATGDGDSLELRNQLDELKKKKACVEQEKESFTRLYNLLLASESYPLKVKEIQDRIIELDKITSQKQIEENERRR